MDFLKAVVLIAFFVLLVVSAFYFYAIFKAVAIHIGYPVQSATTFFWILLSITLCSILLNVLEKD